MKKLIYGIAVFGLGLTVFAQQEENEDEHYSDKVKKDRDVWVFHQDAKNEAKLKELPAGKNLLKENDLAAFKINLSGKQKDWMVNKEIVPIEDMPFKNIIRLNVEKGPDGGKIDLTAKNTDTMTRGDYGLATFWARSVSSGKADGEADLLFNIQMCIDPWHGSIKRELILNKKWQCFYIPFKTKVKFQDKKRIIPGERPMAKPGEVRIEIRTGPDKKVIEIGGIACVDYGDKVHYSQMPITSISYKGREEDAPWRKEAAERIEKIRKGSFSVKSFFIWGFWDERHHRNNAVLFRSDWSLKPSGKVFEDLVLNKWWTRENGRTGENGAFSFRGFFGKYQVTVSADGKKVADEVIFARDGEKINIVMK